MVISLAMICSCQKQDATAEQQLAQRKVELDTREDALIERVNELNEKVNALDEKVKALAEKETAALNARTIPTDVQPQISKVFASVLQRWNKIGQIALIRRPWAPDQSTSQNVHH